MIYNKEFYLNTFNVSERELDNLMQVSLAQGGEYADLYFENSYYYSLLLRDEQVSAGGFNIDYGVGVRVLKNDRTGYSYCESTDQHSMKRAAEAASFIASANTYKSNRGDINPYQYQSCNNLPKELSEVKDRYPIISNIKDIGNSSKQIQFLLKLQDRLKAKDDRIIKVIAKISLHIGDYLMYNSFYELRYESRPMISISLTIICSHKGRTENNSVSKSFRAGIEILSEELIDSLVENALKNLDELFSASRPKGGAMPVVIAAGAGGILLHEAMGHAFEADFNRKGQSVFSNMLGKKVCDENINIVDDGTIPLNRGSINYDDEGIAAQKTYLVKQGILNSYLHDRISAKMYNTQPSGNGRRESFRYSPLPRMRTTYMENGTAKKEDLIADIKKGIFVEQFSNGQVKIGEGDFTFYVKSGREIENGRLTKAIKDINIIGNGPDCLKNIVAVCDDLIIDDSTWTCGKGQSVPVSCGIPTILVNNLIVGGE